MPDLHPRASYCVLCNSKMECVAHIAPMGSLAFAALGRWHPGTADWAWNARAQ
jgi:hypothetical protein